MFEGGSRKVIRLSRYGQAYWGTRSAKYPSFSKNTLKLAVAHLIQNCHFTVGNYVMRQCIGIPMGIDPAPFWANLYLYAYENDFMTNLIGNNRLRAKRFHATRRFIDDLCGINDGGEFGRSHPDIYPNELELKLEHAGNRATFLNLDITIEDGKFIFKLFDKRDEFPFSIVRMPYKDSNIPLTIFYASLVGEFLRIGRSSMLFRDFLPKARDLLDRMIRQGANASRVRRVLRKLMFTHWNVFSIFGFDLESLLERTLA